MRRYYQKLRDARKALAELKKKDPTAELYDLKKSHPKRKNRYFVGNYYEWLNF